MFFPVEWQTNKDTSNHTNHLTTDQCLTKIEGRFPMEKPKSTQFHGNK
jgi:hypothetical protein